MSQVNSDGMPIESETIELSDDIIQTDLPRKKNDALLKSYFEKHINELLLFIYPDIGDLLDITQTFVSCDKELHEMNMDRESSETTRRVDLLFKGKLKSGEEQFFLINIEIEGGNDHFFGERFFNYYIHILAKFKKPVVSLVVYTGDEKQPRPTEHKTSLLGTSMHFKFESYWVYDHSAEELLAMDNIFAMIVAAVQASQLEKKVSENTLGDHRIAIAKALLSSDKLEKKEAGAFMKFLKSIIFIKNPEINLKFDNYVNNSNKADMGVIETFEHFAKEEGIQEGIQKGKQEEAEAKSREFVLNLISQTDFDDNKIAALAGVYLTYVQKIRTELKNTVN